MLVKASSPFLSLKQNPQIIAFLQYLEKLLETMRNNVNFQKNGSNNLSEQ
jgi:hypothetical protein